MTGAQIYVIGDYGRGDFSILNGYDSYSDARRAVDWQGVGMSACTWHNRERCTVKQDGARGYETTFYICRPTAERGVFVTVQNNNRVEVTGTCMIPTAHAAQLDAAADSVKVES